MNSASYFFGYSLPDDQIPQLLIWAGREELINALLRFELRRGADQALEAVVALS